MHFCTALLQFSSSYRNWIVRPLLWYREPNATLLTIPVTLLISNWIGHTFEYHAKGAPDLVVRFCKDVETRSQTDYVGFGRFSTLDYFLAGNGQVNFVRGFYGGDLLKCEKSYDEFGRTAQVNILCGNCLNGQCKGGLGWICNVTYGSNCRVLVELALPCEKPGPKVFQGLTVGFHPRSWEIAYDGMTQFGFEQSHHEFSFPTEQTRVSLYMTAVASLSSLVKNPIYNVIPERGLEISLSESGATGQSPTTLSPTMLTVDWRCEIAHDTPYKVNISIPIEGYESIHFILTKICGPRGRHRKRMGNFRSGFICKTKVEGQRGIDALPGMTLVSACLETVSETRFRYSRPEDTNSSFTSEASWERPPTTSQRGPTERNYGAI